MTERPEGKVKPMNVSNELARLEGAFQNLQQHMTDENRKSTSSLQQQIERLQSAVALLEQSQTGNSRDLFTLRMEQLEMRATVSAHGDDLAILKAISCETARHASLMSDTLERQGSVLQQLNQVASERATALQSALESLTCTSAQAVLAIPV
jgi:flagellar biosynthesis/type III secretory pathway chaperone